MSENIPVGQRTVVTTATTSDEAVEATPVVGQPVVAQPVVEQQVVAEPVVHRAVVEQPVVTNSGDVTALNNASVTQPAVVADGSGAVMTPMTEEELREVAAREAAQNDAMNAEVRQRVDQQRMQQIADETDLAITGTGQGDNRDETRDPDIAAGLGGVGGAIVGAAAGAMLGPAGALAGAVVAGLTGMGAAGLAVDAVDRADDDNTTSGLPPADEDTVRDDRISPVV